MEESATHILIQNSTPRAIDLPKMHFHHCFYQVPTHMCLLYQYLSSLPHQHLTKGVHSSLRLQGVTNISKKSFFSGQRCEQVLQTNVLPPNQPAASIFEQPAPTTSKGNQDVNSKV